MYQISGSGGPTVRADQTIENIREVINAAPTTSLQKVIQQVALSYGTCITILNK